jgi:hypothetical protein
VPGRFARVGVLVAALAIGAAVTPPGFAADCASSSLGFKPLTELGSGSYKGEKGALYPGGSNKRPSSHTTIGKSLAEQRVLPRNPAGTPDAKNGKLVFLSIGMSNAEAEFREFVHAASADPLKSAHVTVVNGAVSGQEASEISDPSARYWSVVDERLGEAGVTGPQVGTVWLKQAEGNEARPFPVDAQQLEENLAKIVRILKERFPNLWLVYLSSRIYGGYAVTGVSPEPGAYQNGFGVKWVIERQLEGSLPVGAGSAPWLSWGPYMWADGTDGRADGLKWVCSDFLADGTHPSRNGSEKVTEMLLDFVHTDATARIWYRGVGQSVGPGTTPGPVETPTPDEMPSVSPSSPIALPPGPASGGGPSTALLLGVAPLAAFVAYRMLRRQPSLPKGRTPA